MLSSFSALQVLETEVGSSFLCRRHFRDWATSPALKLCFQLLVNPDVYSENLKLPQCSPSPAISILLFPLVLVTLVPWRQQRLWPLDERLGPADLQPGEWNGHGFVSVGGPCRAYHARPQ